MKKIIGLLFIALWMLSGMAAAEEKEPGFWADSNYDFSQVRRVCVLEPEFASDVRKDDYGDLKKLFLKNSRLRNVKIVLMNEVQEQIRKESGTDIRKMNAQEGWKLFLEQLPKYADLMIDAKVVRCGIIVRDSAMQTAVYQVSDGGDVNQPIYGNNHEIVGYGQTSHTERVRLVGGRGEELMVAKIDWNIYDLRTNKAVIVATQEGTVPTKFMGAEYGMGGLDLMNTMPNWNPKRVFDLSVESFFSELSKRINGR